MLGDRWICDRVTTERFPDYTRGNAADVLADPVSPLAWTFCWEPGAVLGCRDGFEQMGIFDANEYDADFPETFGLFGGYFYNSLTQARLFGIRSGAGWETVDATYFDSSSQAIPPYREQDWHNSPCHQEKLGKTVAWVMSTDSVPETELIKWEAEALRASRPDLAGQSDEQVLGRAKMLQRHLRTMFAQVVWTSLGASASSGALAALTGEDDPTASVKLITGIGDVDSADIAAQIFAISRIVRRSDALMAAFDGDIDTVAERIEALDDDEADAFGAAVEQFLYQHGGRGPNEWDVYRPCYETHPKLLFQAIERARGAGDDADPARTVASGGATRQELITKYRAMFAGDAEAAGTFEAAVTASAVFMAARERCKSANIRAHNEVRQCFDEIGRRMVERGHLDDHKHLYMLTADELDDFMADPASFKATVAERAADFELLHDLEPPYVVDGSVPPLSTWERKNAGEVEAVAAGDTLTGVSGSPGTVTGRACIMLDLSDPSRLEPGDILIAPQTDPAWTPLFLAAGGVVTNVGAVASHAVIVSRELGIPCVPSVADATRRIPDGAIVTVDGGAGTITIDQLPS